MNFEFSDEQTMIRESLSRYLRDTYDFDARGKILASDEGWSRKTWSDLAELGIMGAAFDESYDGFGGAPSDTLVIMEELGKALVLEPFLPTVMLCGKLLSTVGGEIASDLIGKICAGEMIMGLAHAEPKSRFSRSRVDTAAKASGDSYVLSGHKSVVLAAPIADMLIVSARTSGELNDAAGISLFLVDPKAKGVTLQGYRNIDGHLAGDIILDNVTASSRLGELDAGFTPLSAAIDHGCLAITAEAIGLCKSMCHLTNQYIQQRQQFGVPISKFQALQHKMVDMFIHQEELVSMAYMATAKFNAKASVRSAAISAAKVQLGKSCKFVGENAVQLHGGMGMTEEMSIGHYFMRGTMLELMFGDSDVHLSRFMLANKAA